MLEPSACSTWRAELLVTNPGNYCLPYSLLSACPVSVADCSTVGAPVCAGKYWEWVIQAMLALSFFGEWRFHDTPNLKDSLILLSAMVRVWDVQGLPRSAAVIRTPAFSHADTCCRGPLLANENVSLQLLTALGVHLQALV